MSPATEAAKTPAHTAVNAAAAARRKLGMLRRPRRDSTSAAMPYARHVIEPATTDSNYPTRMALRFAGKWPERRR
jgi:hypothetical protein